MAKDRKSIDWATHAGRGARFLHGLGRWLRRIVWTVAIFVVTLVVLLAVVQLTPAGRRLVLGIALDQTNALIPGRVDVAELHELNVWGVELVGIKAWDPHDTPVLSVGRVAIETDLPALLRGTIGLRSVVLRDAWVDARVLEERRGLLAAFVDPDAPETPPNEEGSGMPPLRIAGISVHSVSARLPEIDPVGQVDVELDELLGSFSLINEQVGVGLTSLKLAAIRETDRLLELEASGKLRPDDTSEIRLNARSGDIALDLDARATVPPQDGWQTDPFTAEVDLRGVRAARIATILRDPALADAFLGEVAVHVTAQGTPQKPTLEGAISTAGGTVTLTDVAAAPNEWRATLATEKFQLDRVRTDLPPHQVTVELAAKAAGTLVDDLDVELQVRRAALDGTRLVDLDVEGHLEENQVRDLELRAHDGDSHLDAEGTVRFDGGADLALRLDLRPELVHRLGGLADQNLTARIVGNAQVHAEPGGEIATSGRVELDEFVLREKTASAQSDDGTDAAPASITLRRLETQFDLSGALPLLRGKASVLISDANVNGHLLQEAELRVEGSPTEAVLTLDALGHLDPTDPGATDHNDPKNAAELHVSTTMKRQGQGTRLTGEGSGKLAGEALVFDLGTTSIRDDGAVRTQGLVLGWADQEVHVEGAINASGHSEGLQVKVGPLDLEKFNDLNLIEEKLTGKLSAEAVWTGSTARPQLELSVRGRQLGLVYQPLIDLDLDAKLDSPEGEASLGLAVRGKAHSEPKGIRANLDATAEFDGRRPVADALPDATLTARFDLDHLETSFVRPYLPAGTLPVDASLGSLIEIEGTLEDPHLKANNAVTIRLAGEPPVVVSQDLGYERGQVDTQIDVKDGKGPWMSLLARLVLPGQPPAVAELGDAFSRAGPEGEWEAHFSSEARALPQIPLLSLATDPQDLPPFSVDVDWDVTHAPHSEPVFSLTSTIEQVAALTEAECSSERVKLRVKAEHQDDRNRVTVVGNAGSKELMRTEVRLPMALSPVLSGATPTPGPLEVQIESQGLDIAGLPGVCGKARGQLYARITGSDLLGKQPLLDVSTTIRGLSLGSPETLNLVLQGKADSSKVLADLRLLGAGKHRAATAHVEGSLPWTFQEGNVSISDSAPLSATVSLSRIPLAPLLPKDGPISYPTGTINAQLEAQGTLDAPVTRGEITLDDVAFTSTSVAQPLRNIEGRLLIDNRTITIEHLEAHDRDGVVNLKGQVDLTDLEKVHGRIEIDAKDFPLRQRGQVVAVTQLKAVAESTVTPEHTEAHLLLQNVDTWLNSVALRSGIDQAPHPEFVIDGRPAPDSDEARRLEARNPSGAAAPSTTGEDSTDEDSTAKDSTGKNDDGKETTSKETTSEDEDSKNEDSEEPTVQVILDATDRFWVKRDDFAVKLSAHLEANIKGSDVRVRGDVTIDRGYLQLFGKVFDLSRESQLRFIGTNPPNPVLELAAEHKTRGGSIVSVRITGRANEPILTFLVDGEEVDAGVAVQELFGGNQNSGDSDASAQARSFVSGLTAGVLATAARRELGAAAPILMIDPSDKAGEGRIRAGFELDDLVPEFLKPVITGVYLEGIVSRESEAETAATTQFGALIEFYFPKNFFTAGQYGPGTTWSVDLGWQL